MKMNQQLNIKKLFIFSTIALFLSLSFNCSLAFSLDQLVHLKHEHGIHESSTDNQELQNHSHKHKHADDEKEHEHKHFNTSVVSEVITREQSSIILTKTAKTVSHIFHYTFLKSGSYILEILRPPIHS